MIDSYPTIQQLKTSQRLRRNVVTALALVVVLLIVGSMTAIAMYLPHAEPLTLVLGAVAMLICLAVPVCIWYRPSLGIYLVLIGALLFPSSPLLAVPTMPTTYVPFWWNLSTIGSRMLGTGALNGIAVSPNEIIMVLALCSWLVRGVALRQIRWEFGSFFWFIAAYIAMVTCGFVNGITHGGNLTMALYEIRGQFYFFLTYILAANLLNDRKHVRAVLWTIVICNGIQALFGTITFFALHDRLSEDGFMLHDESLVLNLVFFIAILAPMVGKDRRLGRTALALTPLALVAVLGNQRRAGIAAFIIAFLPLLPMLWVTIKERRKQIASIAVIFAMASAVYLPLAWNSNGAWALPARAIRSQSDPSARDASSNTYRNSEDFDLLVTRDVSPIIGYGYGKPFLQPVQLPAVSTDFVYYMSHNSILWVWMRLGHIGFFLFWMMIASFLVRGVQLLKEATTSEGRQLGFLAVLMVLMMLTFGHYDLALVDGKILTIAAILLGMLSILPKIEGREANTAGDAGAESLSDAEESLELSYDPAARVRSAPMPF